MTNNPNYVDACEYEEIDHIQFFICMFAGPIAWKGTAVKDCDAGCGQKIIFDVSVPSEIPKVCPYCGAWASNCAGNA